MSLTMWVDPIGARNPHVSLKEKPQLKMNNHGYSFLKRGVKGTVVNRRWKSINEGFTFPLTLHRLGERGGAFDTFIVKFCEF